LTGAVTAMLESIQKAMFERAQGFMRENTAEPRTYDEFRQAIEAGLFCRVWWSGDAGREAAIKEETKATIRCIPLEQPGGEGVCIGTGRPAKQVAIFAPVNLARSAPSAERTSRGGCRHRAPSTRCRSRQMSYDQ
jgi:prolyl-tRNA synthetase